MSAIRDAIAEIELKISKLQETKANLLELVGEQPVATNSRSGAVKTTTGAPKQRRQMSDAAKDRIRAAQQRRWAAAKGEAPVQESPAIPIEVESVLGSMLEEASAPEAPPATPEAPASSGAPAEKSSKKKGKTVQAE